MKLPAYMSFPAVPRVFRLTGSALLLIVIAVVGLLFARPGESVESVQGVSSRDSMDQVSRELRKTAKTLDATALPGLSNEAIGVSTWITKYKMRRSIRHAVSSIRMLNCVSSTATSILAGHASERVANPWEYASFNSFYEDTLLKCLPPATQSAVYARADTIKKEVGAVGRALGGFAKVVGLGLPGWMGSLINFLEMPLATGLDNVAIQSDKALRKAFGIGGSAASWQVFSRRIMARFAAFDRYFGGLTREVGASRDRWEDTASEAAGVRLRINASLAALALYAKFAPSDSLYLQPERLASAVATAIDTAGARASATPRFETLYAVGEVDGILSRFPQDEETQEAVLGTRQRFSEDIALYDRLAMDRSQDQLVVERRALAEQAVYWLRESKRSFEASLADARVSR